ncbi:hypothetical protein SAMN05216388_102816 [Halorientalis persicus]|uniref:Uncharacterized protein n=1 Tax=Halorientalis persicus TaxID=1367881 RepID=A0A1H8UJH8_9EURY|nr:hypothetical protein SAMN05216388_102816 [Halorientalis persicus]
MMLGKHLKSHDSESEQCVSRRRLLAWSGTAIVGGLAGCAGNGNQGNNSDSPATTSSPSEDSVFEESRFDGPEIVVTLSQDHGVSRLNLIAPDGSLYTQADVAEGATTVRLRVMDIQPGLGDYEHYSPGTYELTAVREDSSQSRELEMRPNLQLTEASHYQDGANQGNLALTIENTGTAPTWPYQIVYRDAPNEAANAELNDKKGIPQFITPEDPVENIIGPGEAIDIVGNTPPVVFTDDDSTERTCDDQTVEFTAVVGTVVGSPLEQEIEVTLSGERSGVGTSDTYTCSEIAAELTDGGGTDAS